MHFLDLIMYVVLLFVIWGILDIMSGGEFTHEMGGLIGMSVIIIYTIVYIILFAIVPDWNWADFNYPTFTNFFKW